MFQIINEIKFETYIQYNSKIHWNKIQLNSAIQIVNCKILMNEHIYILKWTVFSSVPHETYNQN